MLGRYICRSCNNEFLSDVVADEDGFLDLDCPICGSWILAGFDEVGSDDFHKYNADLKKRKNKDDTRMD